MSDPSRRELSRTEAWLKNHEEWPILHDDFSILDIRFPVGDGAPTPLPFREGLGEGSDSSENKNPLPPLPKREGSKKQTKP